MVRHRTNRLDRALPYLVALDHVWNILLFFFFFHVSSEARVEKVSTSITIQNQLASEKDAKILKISPYISL